MLFSRLVRLYERRGFTVRSSVTPYLFEKLIVHPEYDLCQTYLFKEGRHQSGWGGGIHMSEVYLLECLGQVFRPERVFVIGNSFGWSTLALALANPGARVVAMDACFAPQTAEGMALTNRIAAEEGLNAEAVRGVSPGDVGRVVERHLGGPIDLALIDGLHSDEQQIADYRAIRAHASARCVVLFHDVVACKLLGSLHAIFEAEPDRTGRLLTRTNTGMGVLYPKSLPAEVDELLAGFSDPMVEMITREVDGQARPALRARMPRRDMGASEATGGDGKTGSGAA